MKHSLLRSALFAAVLMIQTGFSQTAVMNEIYSRGTTEAPDWIEIYNPGQTQIDITGFKIYDSGGQAGTKPKKEFPAGSIIPANGFLVIVTDDTAASGFGLSSGGEKVWLENATGTVIDTVTFPAMDITQTYGRYPDGSANMKLLNTITRGTSNVLFKMNEIYSRGTTEAPDWIEIYNSSAAPVDITGFKIYDSGGMTGTKPKKEFPAGSIIPANGFLVIVTDDTTASGFGLSSGGEKVWIEDAAGLLLDSVAFTAMTETQSYGRYPDGSPFWQLLNTITRGSANIITSIEDESVVDNYSLSQNYPNPFNPSTTIRFTLKSAGFVTLKIYNILGVVVSTLINETMNAGAHQVTFNAAGLSSGVYFYQLTSENYTETRKLNLLK